MGGAVKSVTNTFSNIVHSPTRFGTALVTAGGSELARLNPLVNKGLGLADSTVDKMFGYGGGGNGNINAPTVGGKQDPLSMLTMSGGAPLLTNIALGADPKTALMGYFGASGNYDTWFNNLSDSDQSAIKGLSDQLGQIQANTDMRNSAVQKLTQDFPNIMASAIPKYSAMADEATKGLMDQAMSAISAKQAAGGMFSSGATAEAAAKAGAGIGMDKLNFGTNLALQDFSQQYSAATALQSFQQKMLGQGATQGFNAVQNALQRNTGIAGQQADLQYKADTANSQSEQGMWGALGSLGGTAIGGMFGGLPGAALGQQAGQMLASGNSGFTGSPRLNLNTGVQGYR